jgi:uncharacterized spore protein YtfJ
MTSVSYQQQALQPSIQMQQPVIQQQSTTQVPINHIGNSGFGGGGSDFKANSNSGPSGGPLSGGNK